jgi:hypothetical protein
MHCPTGDWVAICREGRFRDSDLLRHVFETTVARGIADGLVSDQRFPADANKQNATPKEDWDTSAIKPEDAPRAVREYCPAVHVYMHERGQDQTIRNFDAAQKEGGNALRPPQTHSRAGTAEITRALSGSWLRGIFPAPQ